MSYTNQLEAFHLNRHLAHKVLQQLRESRVLLRTDGRSYVEHLAYLRSRTQSDFERRFLDFLAGNGYRLPSEAQKSLVDPRCIADFFYEPNVVVFCDGPPHDQPHQQAIDERLRNELRTLGYRVLVLRWDEDLVTPIQRYPEVFYSRFS